MSETIEHILIDRAQFNQICAAKKFSRRDRKTIEKFFEQGQGQDFVLVADVLKKNGLKQECISLLLKGLRKFPEFLAARVLTVREMLYFGLVQQSWQVLTEKNDDIDQNPLAQLLHCQLALLTWNENIFNIYLQRKDFDFQLNLRLHELLKSVLDKGFEVTRSNLIQKLRMEGAALTEQVIFELERIKNSSSPLEDRISHYVQSQLVNIEKMKVNSFQAVPIHQVFEGDFPLIAEHVAAGSVLSTETMAEIYFKQGIFEKSRMIYLNLLKTLGDSSKDREEKNHLQDKIKNCEDQLRLRGQSLDHLEEPDVQNWENLQMIDQQLNIYQDMLKKLSL